tara:strand:+ start:6436 stop:6870 length:435 start_codon:yes stop_codon:yes gene_type:complete
MKLTLIGSVSAADKFVETYNNLRKLGHEPTIHEDMFEYSKTSWEEVHDKSELREHAQTKIDNDYIKWWHKSIMDSDGIVVLNYDKKGIKNYVGGNTLMEIGFAYVADKEIYLMNPIPEDVPYTDEIEAMVKKENILNGDLNNII